MGTCGPDLSPLRIPGEDIARNEMMRPKCPWTMILILTLALAVSTLRLGHAASITVDTSGDVLDAAGTCGAVDLASLPGPDGVNRISTSRLL